MSDLLGWVLFGAADVPAQPEFAHSAVAAFGLGRGGGGGENRDGHLWRHLIGDTGSVANQK